MSHEATAWAFRQKGLKPAAKIVLFYLADHHNPEHGCFPSQKRLADECEMSERSVRDHLKALEELKLITRHSREKVCTKFSSDEYELHFDRQLTEAGKPAAKSAARQNLPSAESSNSRRQNLPPNPVRGISKTRAREAGASSAVIPDRPAPHLRTCIPRGSVSETRWNEWLAQHGYPYKIAEIGEPVGDGFDALTATPPGEHDDTATMMAKRWADRLVALHHERKPRQVA